MDEDMKPLVKEFLLGLNNMSHVYANKGLAMEEILDCMVTVLLSTAHTWGVLDQVIPNVETRLAVVRKTVADMSLRH